MQKNNQDLSILLTVLISIAFFTGILEIQNNTLAQTSTQSSSRESYQYLGKWGTNGTSGGQFFNPDNIAIDQFDNVYITHIYNNTIQKFDSDGNFITKWDYVGSYHHLYFNDIGDGFASSDYVYFSDIDVDVDSSENVYISDYGNNNIQKFDSDGNFITKWGSHGIFNGQLQYPNSVAVDSADNVYVADTNNSRIQKFDSSGNFVTKWGSEGSANGQFHFPNGIDIDFSDNVYVSDTNDNRIQKFDSSGNFLSRWGSEGSAEGLLSYPMGIAVDSSGKVYISDLGNSRIQVFAQSNTDILDNNGNTESSPAGITDMV